MKHSQLIVARVTRRHGRSVRLGLSALVVGLATASPALAQTPASAIAEKLDAEVPRLMEAGEVPGLSAALVLDGELVWSGAFGVADAETGQSVTPSTIFQAASLTKQFFAYTALRLADRGVIDLDRPLAEYLPYPRLEHEERYRRITARIVLSHSTGLPNWGGENLQLGFDPGTDFNYSGEGYVYLQRTLEHLTGEDLGTLVEREVLEPLGLENSWMAWHEKFEGRTAAGHDEWGVSQGVSRGEEVNAAWSLLTTAQDYARFLIALMEGRGLEPPTLADGLERQIQVATRPRIDTDDKLYWGLGWGLQYGRGGRALWQWGHNDGFRGYFLAFPDRRDALVYFTNGGTGMSIARGLLALAADAAGFPTDEHWALDWLNYEQHDAPDRVARRGLVRAFREEGIEAGLARYESVRADLSGGEAEALAATVGRALESQGLRDAAIAILERNVELRPRSANALAALGDVQMEAGRYHEALEIHERALALSPGHQGATRTRDWLKPAVAALDDPPPVRLSVLERYLGDYGPRHITIENGALHYQRDGNPRYRLHPMSEDTFLLDGLGSFRIRFLTDDEGRPTKIVGLYVNGNEDETPRSP